VCIGRPVRISLPDISGANRPVRHYLFQNLPQRPQSKLSRHRVPSGSARTCFATSSGVHPSKHHPDGKGKNGDGFRDPRALTPTLSRARGRGSYIWGTLPRAALSRSRTCPGLIYFTLTGLSVSGGAGRF
jgi:hypothetical protein